MMWRLSIALGMLACLPAAAADLDSAPRLEYRVVPGWPELPKGWNFGECSGVDVDADDNVWVFHRGKRAVMQFDPGGRLIQAWEDVPVVAAHGIRVGPEGNIWLVDVGGHAVLKCDRTGRIRMVIATAGHRPGGQDAKYAFNKPTALAFTPDGKFFYVSDGYGNSRVVRYSKDGVYQNHWGAKGTGDGEFNLVHDVCVDEKGRVYVADRTNQRIQVFDAEGRFLNKWTGIGSPWGLYYVKREKAIYMADGVNNRIVKLNLDGQVLGVFGGFGKAPGKLDFAHHLAVDSTGAVYVTEIKNWRVQKFVPAAGK